MIASLAGTLQHKAVQGVVIDVRGVGYLVHVSAQCLADLPAEGSPVTLLCHTHVREEVLQLFGFLRARERTAFELLKTVSGVGPKLALTILSGMPVEDLVRAVADGAVPRLMKCPGVGKKTAERLVVELKEKFAAIATAIAPSDGARADDLDHLVDALTGLGYKRPLAERAVKQLGRTADTKSAPEVLLRAALKVIQEL